MKVLQTDSFQKKADLITYPPVPNVPNSYREHKKRPLKKKKKKLPQTNMIVDDITVQDLVD